MAPAAARRAATAAVRYAFSTAKYAAAAPPRAAVIRHAAPRATAIHHRAASSVAAGSAATPPSAVSIRQASSSVGATRSAAPAPSAVAIRHASSPVAATRSAATRSAACIAPLAGNRATARFGLPSGRLTKATSPAGMRSFHVMVGTTIEPHVQIELSRLDARAFSRYKEVAEAIQLLGLKLAEEEAASLQYMTEHVIHVGTVSWRVCTTVLTVAVAAGFGVLQLAQSGWESEFHESACSLITSTLAEAKLELEDAMVKGITHRRNVAIANAFLHNEKLKEKALELTEREEALVAREAALAVK